jgi:ketosteroid isomerase-like protein
MAVTAAATPPEARDCDANEEVRAAFMRLVDGERKHDPEAIMRSITQDAVLSYPGLPDADVPKMAEGFRKQFANPAAKSLRYDVTIEDILTSGDLAVVRAIWTVRGVKADGTAFSSQEKDMEIWRRQPSGEWKLLRGMSFPLRKPASESTQK